MTKTLVGIDLGTTYSLVSVLQDGQTVLLPNALGELLTPSASISVRAVGVNTLMQSQRRLPASVCSSSAR